uniref:Beta-catenin-like protein 1 n=1 Tax=Tetraselmis sp. GSL018 TaxID=582737 RepID=A0A061R0X7_9CHLO|eukprot:CAMPEP_0177609150 /NCGR_PEP_ID=MMETSP0419_2-20121207/18907_1 /TAXON_ID=582737 /ORGANISM="Tetraselmis sp., Strain GSL018" /LENGTH=633 /DNA_ID=CAMNT_0019103999 /DNA_START=214 /DNA_END=2115 /DNA_ORIENTATION=+
MSQVVGMKRKAPGASKVAGALEDLDAAVRQEERARAAAAAAAAEVAAKASRAALPSGSAPSFIASATFTGAKAGYYFGSGAQGVGYYLDPRRDVEPEPPKAEQKTLDPEDLLREAEEATKEQEVFELLDVKGLRRLMLSFERKYKANAQMRMKHGDQPERFMESEVELASEIKRLFIIAGSPELYPELVNLSAVPTLLELLRHENTDIAADAIDLIRELTDSDVVEDNEEEAEVLVEALLENNVLELLVQRLGSFDESVDEEATGVFNTLSIFENLVEVKPEVAEAVVEKTKLLRWMLSRLKPREFTSNKQTVSEVLGILTQKSTANQTALGAQGGIDVLLTSVAPYRSRDPASHEEEEFMENIFDVLSSCLLVQDNKQLFVEAEGVQLMLLILKRKKSIARAGALKTLDFAMTKYAPAVEQFVAFTDEGGGLLGLKVLFTIFMGRTKLKKKESSIDQEVEERCISLISSIFQGLSRGSKRDRVAAKFVENEYEKCDRLMEIFLRYRGSVIEAEDRLEQQAAEDEEEVDQEELLLSRMDAGLYTLQQSAVVIGHLWNIGDMGIRRRLLMLLHQKGCALSMVREALQDYHDNIGTGDSEEFSKQKRRVMRLIEAMHKPSGENGKEGWKDEGKRK